MQNWLKGAAIALASVAGTLAISQMMRGPLEGRTPDVTVLRTADGKPDLNGIWQAVGSANWNLQDHQARSGPVLELGAVARACRRASASSKANEIPYQPWAAAKKKENYENWLSRDPEVKCYLPGRAARDLHAVPVSDRAVRDSDILMAYEFASASRVIKMGKAEPPPVDTWMGQSAGRWEGDTLVVDVTGLNDQTWFDRAGNFHSEALHVVERFTPRARTSSTTRPRSRIRRSSRGRGRSSMPLYRRSGQERAAPRVQVRRVRRGVDVRHLRKKTGNEKPFTAARLRWP